MAFQRRKQKNNAYKREYKTYQQKNRGNKCCTKFKEASLQNKPNQSQTIETYTHSFTQAHAIVLK